MSDFSNITVAHQDDDKVALLVDGKPISERYAVQFESNIVDELKALQDGKALKLFDQFIFSHSDLNFEHAYSYVTCMVKADSDYKVVCNFVYRITAAGQAPMENVITKQGQPMSSEDIREFIDKHVAMSLNEYTDLKYAY